MDSLPVAQPVFVPPTAQTVFVPPTAQTVFVPPTAQTVFVPPTAKPVRTNALLASFIKQKKISKPLSQGTQRIVRSIMVVLTLFAMIMFWVFAVDAGLKFAKKKGIIPRTPAWVSVLLVLCSLMAIPLVSVIHLKYGTSYGFIVKY